MNERTVGLKSVSQGPVVPTPVSAKLNLLFKLSYPSSNFKFRTNRGLL